MMDSDWSRRIHLHWVYVRESGQWLARRPGSAFQPLAAVLAEYDEPVFRPFPEADGSTEYRDRQWLLANMPPAA